MNIRDSRLHRLLLLALLASPLVSHALSQKLGVSGKMGPYFEAVPESGDFSTPMLIHYDAVQNVFDTATQRLYFVSNDFAQDTRLTWTAGEVLEGKIPGNRLNLQLKWRKENGVDYGWSELNHPLTLAKEQMNWNRVNGKSDWFILEVAIKNPPPHPSQDQYSGEIVLTLAQQP
jgi:hypothetical protein